MAYSATTYGLGAVEDRSEAMASEAQRRIKEKEGQIRRPLLREEKLQVIAQVQAENGLTPRFNDKLPVVPWYQGILNNVGVKWAVDKGLDAPTLAKNAGKLAAQPFVGASDALSKNAGAIALVALVGLYLWKKA